MLKNTIEQNEMIQVNSKELEILKDSFPQCFDEEGNFDMKLFEELVKTKDISIKKEGYSLNFLGKSYARYLSNLDSETVIVPDESNKDNPSENVYIVGDNLDALQHLKYSYAGAIKCIYIDPPYNTGSDGFVYNDKFEFTAKDLAEKIGIEEDEAERILNMQGKSTHSAWLTFMYPRLELAKELLSEDGVIFISIDDNEQANCKLLCDMIFGENNFVGELIWQSATDNNLRQISTEHEYILCYGKAAETLPKWAVDSQKAKLIEEYYHQLKKETDNISEIEKKLRQWIKDNKDVLIGVTHYNNVDEKGVYSNSSNSSNTKPGGYTFDIIHPKTGKPCVKPAFGWRWTEATFWAYDDVGDVEWGVDETTQPHIKKRIHTVTEQLKSIYYEDGRAATKLLESLFGNKKVFDNPKPLNLIKRLLNFSSDEDAIVLDFFSGSATTAHAVLEENLKGNHRKFILVQIPENLDIAYSKATASEKTKIRNTIEFLDSVHREHTIDQIGIERIIRAAAKIKKDEPEKSKGVDLGFKTYYLKSPEVQTLDKIRDFNPDIPLDAGDIIKAFGEDTVLETWKIKDGYGFNTPVKEIDLNGYIAYLINDGIHGANLYLLDEISENQIMELVRKLENAELVVDKIIEYGYALSYTANTSLRTNLKTLKNRNSIDVIIRY